MSLMNITLDNSIIEVHFSEIFEEQVLMDQKIKDVSS